MSNKMFMVIDASSKLFFGVLAKHRSPGAIPFGGKYRLIDFALSNATFSGITNVAIFPSNNYRSLRDHIGSGDRYDLDRRLDGVFILPPKTLSPVDEEFLSFKKFYEQKEYFLRSSQEYVVITPATLVWSIDFNDVLSSHIKSGADITEIVNSKKKRMYTFILKKDKLMEYVMHYGDVSFRNIVDVYDYSTSIKRNKYKVLGLAEYVNSNETYFNVSMKLLKTGEIFTNIDNNRVRTKDPINSPSYYGKNAKVNNSIVSSGALIYGAIDNSIISRRALIEEGAIVKNSIIMNTVRVKKNAVIENAIIDKECVIEEGVVLKGTKEFPFIAEKGMHITSQESPNVAILTAECSPYIKRGGLADMVGSLSFNLSKIGANIFLFLPLYKDIKNKNLNMENDIELNMEIDSKEYHINTYKISVDKCEYIFIDLYMYFDRDNVYGYKDDAYRFAYYSKAVMEYVKAKDLRIDIFHMNDWHTALLPLFKKKYPEYESAKTMLTIHNLNYQGEVSKELISHFDLDYYVGGNTLNILESGINSSDIITTVSKTYAEELKYSYYSGNLNNAILRRQSSLYGIVNGLDEKFSPSRDLEIAEKYDSNTVFKKKPTNKKFLCDLCGFEYDNSFVIGMVSRLDYIKGFDLVIDSMDEFLKDERVKFVLLGDGDKRIKDSFMYYQEKYPNQVKCFLEYHGTKAEYIYAGADALLMPSRIEPCGTSQMIALKYGTIPIVRQTGGLNDTIKQFDPFGKLGSGFKFYNYDVRDLIYTINLAKDTYFDYKDNWNMLINNAMSEDNSFLRCAKEYLNLYSMIKKRGE